MKNLPLDVVITMFNTLNKSAENPKTWSEVDTRITIRTSRNGFFW